MSDLPQPSLTFDALRRAAISHAQEASADHWSDYNLHDPGVTLIEQTSYALTELAYRADLPIRDLLTAPDGTLDHAAMALFDPGSALRSAPVTLDDLALFLSTAPGVARVQLRRLPGADGLFSAVVTPRAEQDPQAAARAVAELYEVNRPLCTQLLSAEPAQEVPVILKGAFAIAAGELPERIAADIYLRIGQILRGRPIDDNQERGGRGYSRSDVAIQPMLYEAIVPESGAADSRSACLAALRSVPGLVEVLRLDLADANGALLADFTAPLPDSYPSLVTPQTPDDPLPTLMLDGHSVALQVDVLASEISRLRAERVATTGHQLDPEDWRPARPGTSRSFDTCPSTDSLPALYPVTPLNQARTTPEAAAMAGYHAPIDGLIDGWSADLAALPRLFSADPKALRQSHWGEAPQIARRFDLAGPDWQATRARHDDWKRRRREILDLLLALHGQEPPAEAQTAIDLYHPAALRAEESLARRGRLLDHLDQLNRRRGTGEGGAEPVGHGGGMLEKLLWMADIMPKRDGGLAQVLPEAGLKLVEPRDAPIPTVARAALVPAHQVLDMLVPLLPPDKALPVPESWGPWLAGGALSVAQFHRMFRIEAYLVTDGDPFGWRLCLDPGDGGDLFDCGTFDSREDAYRAANGMARMATAVHRDSEGAYLIEDIALRGARHDFTPHLAWLLMPGWSARMSAPPFRGYLRRLARDLAPAHCQIRPIWADHPQMSAFEPLWRKREDTQARKDLRHLLALIEAAQ